MASVNPTLHTAAIAALEQALNRALQLDPHVGEQLAQLAGSVFQLHCTTPELEVFMLPDAAGITLMGYWDGEVTTGIRGRAADFADLATATDPAAALINGDLELTGDSAPLLALQAILAGLDMDWEAPLVNSLAGVDAQTTAASIAEQSPLGIPCMPEDVAAAIRVEGLCGGPQGKPETEQFTGG